MLADLAETAANAMTDDELRVLEEWNQIDPAIAHRALAPLVAEVRAQRKVIDALVALCQGYPRLRAAARTIVAELRTPKI